MKLTKQDQLYDEQWDVVDTYFNTNGGFGSVVSPDEAEILKKYYFVNSTEHDVYEYRRRMVEINPELVDKAETAARKITEADGMTPEEIDKLFT